MKTIRKIMEGVAAACISVAMYYCFLSGAPARGTERTVYMILDGIFCISAWVAGVGILWYVRWLRRRNKELENMIKMKGYSYILLETGAKQFEAISLYKSCGYGEIENYAPYVGNKNSVCMRKKM